MRGLFQKREHHTIKWKYMKETPSTEPSVSHGRVWVHWALILKSSAYMFMLIDHCVLHLV